MADRCRVLIDALADGPVTDADLADRLDLDGSTVAGAIDDLRDAGFGIEHGADGYRIAAVPEYGLGVVFGLDAPFAVEYHDTVGSTNDRARELAAAGAEDVVVLAGEQTGGRGRLDRGWTSPPGGIYLSVVVRPALAPERAPLLTLAAAVAVVRAARDEGVDASIKWPNDVVAPDGRKLAGVLTESASSAGRIAWAVVGVGVNANVDPADLPDGAASLRECGDGVDRRRFVRTLLEEFHRLREAPETIPDAWREHAATLGRRVRVATDDRAVTGEAVDIDDAGALLVEADDGMAGDAGVVRITAGDCEHLRPA